MEQIRAKDLSNLEKYQKIIKSLNWRGKVVGLDILLRDDDPPANIFLKFAATDTVLFVTLGLYCIYLFYGDFVQAAYSLTTFGMAIDSFMRFYVFIYRRAELRKVQQDTRMLFQRYDADPEVNEKLGKILKFATIANFLTFFSLFNTAIVLASMAIIETVRSGEKTLIFGIYPPMIDYESNLGYAITYLYQVLQMILATFHSTQGDGFFVVHMILACARLEAIGHQIDMLDRYLIAEDRETLSSEEDAKIIDYYLKDILKEHLIHIEYMNRMEYLYCEYAFFLVCSCMFVVVVNLFVLISIFWIQGIFLSFAVLFKIMCFCVLGTVVDNKNDEVVKKLYDMHWYVMPPRQQKAVLMLLRSVQKPVRPTMLIKPLNLTTFLSCLNMIYSICAMLITMIKKRGH